MHELEVLLSRLKMEHLSYHVEGVPCPFAPKVPPPEENFIYINKIHFIFVVCFKVSYVVISETAFIGLKRGI